MSHDDVLRGNYSIPPKIAEHVYATGPIDDFEEMGWTLYDDRASDDWWREHLRSSITRAIAVISTSPRFELDGRSGPWWMRLPSAEYEAESSAIYAVALKIDNNGTTFIWAPCALPWLENYVALTPSAIAAIRRAEVDLDEWLADWRATLQ